MDERQEGILVDKDLRPAYYDDFHCLAADCKLSCCKNWNITFNKKDYLSLKRQKGSPQLDERLERALRRIRKGAMAETFYGEFDMSGGACPLLREDGLCSLQIEKGHEALPYVCRSYPRRETYRLSGYLERSLSSSCEGVLSLLWDLPEGVEFRSDPLPKKDQKQVIPNSDNLTGLWFGVAREWCIDQLQNRRFTLPERIMLMGMGLRRLTEEQDIEAWIPWAQALPEQVEPGSLLTRDERSHMMLLTDMRNILGPKKKANIVSVTVQRAGSDRVENLDAGQWDIRTHLQRATMDLLGTLSIPSYLEARARYEETFQDHIYFMENLMVSIFFYLGFPNTASIDEMWKSYVNFCNLYACHYFAAVLSCRDGVEDNKSELFHLLTLASRALLHNSQNQLALRDELFRHDSATLAHMAILLSG